MCTTGMPGTCGGQKRSLDHLEFELQMMWAIMRVLRIKPGSSGKVAEPSFQSQGPFLFYLAYPSIFLPTSHAQTLNRSKWPIAILLTSLDFLPPLLLFSLAHDLKE